MIFTQQRNGKQTQYIKNKCLLDFIYSGATLQCKVCLIPFRAAKFIELYKIK